MPSEKAMLRKLDKLVEAKAPLTPRAPTDGSVKARGACDRCERPGPRQIVPGARVREEGEEAFRPFRACEGCAKALS